ncbi:MAG TPA: F0F1 ATP synthase subunit A, partial [Patescibacteria group bacterium]|nr:F0F1 ATP synthase subunit A [Patescibacteria group bacterium]
PKGVQNFGEYIIETLLGFIDSVTHNRKKSEKFLPIVGTIFVFILILNWMGQLPGTGTIGWWEVKEGQRILVPFLRPGTSDLNTTLALAVFAVIGTHIFGIAAVGFFKHLNKFFNFGGLVKALKTLNPLKIFTAIVNFFIGLIEVFSEVAKTVSLSLRLFGNVFAGEVLLTVMASLVAYLVPIPFMFLELLVGIVQATIFAMLTLVFMEVATHGGH